MVSFARRVTSEAASPLALSAGLIIGLLALVGCGGSSSKTGSTFVQPAGSSPSADASGKGAPSTVLGAVDSCTLLKPADFTAATTAVESAQDPISAYTFTTTPTKTDVGPAVEQHSACTYHFSGKPGITGEITLDVMTAAEYKSLGTIDTPRPISGLGDEAGVYGERPAFLKGNHGALIANASTNKDFGIALLRALAPRL
jgi:hypothetical protein